MSYDIRNFPDLLRDNGIPVREHGDWKNVGHNNDTTYNGIMLHHDASPKGSTADGWEVIRYGRSDLEGPLSQIWLDYYGTWHFIAAGRCYHAGEGSWQGISDGNGHFIGIETDHTTNEQWTSDQRYYGLRGIWLLADALHILDSSSELKKNLIAHKEWAPDRKIDPDPLNMNDLRALILNPPYSQEAPVKTVQRSCVSPRTLKKDQWIDLQFADEGEVNGSLFIYANGPASWYVASVQAYLSGTPGTEFQLRPYRQRSGGGEEYLYAVRDFVIPKDGNVGVELSFQGSLADDWYLRVMGRSMGNNITVDKTWAETALW